MSREAPFWETKKLTEMSQSEWESLCDGCGKCCLVKLEDEDTGEVCYTDLACHQLDLETCKCKNYAKRLLLVPECLKLDVEMIPQFSWLPKSCAYRRLSEGRSLASWHPLISGDPETVHDSGASVAGCVTNEEEVPLEEWYDHVVNWPEEDI